MFNSTAEIAITVRGLPGMSITPRSPNAINADRMSAKSILAVNIIQSSDSFSCVFIFAVYQKRRFRVF